MSKQNNNPNKNKVVPTKLREQQNPKPDVKKGNPTDSKPQPPPPKK